MASVESVDLEIQKLKFNPDEENFYGIENDKNCKVVCRLGNICDTKSDVCLVLISKNLGLETPISNEIINRAGSQIKNEVSYLLSNQTRKSYTSGGDLRCGKMFYIPTDSNLRSRNELKIRSYFACKLIDTFKEVKAEDLKFSSLSISLDYGDYLNYDTTSFALLIYNVIVDCMIELKVKEVKLNLYTEDKQVFDSVTREMKILTVKGGKQEVSFRSGTCLELHIGSLFDLQVDAIMILVDNEFRLGTMLSRIIVSRVGSKIKKDVEKKLLTLGKKNILVTSGYSLSCKFILLCRTPKKEADKLKCLKNLMVETIPILKEKNIKSLAMPLLGAGSYGLEVDQCLQVLEESLSANNFGRVCVTIPYDSEGKIRDFENYFQRIDPIFKKKKLFWFEHECDSSEILEDENIQRMPNKITEEGKMSLGSNGSPDIPNNNHGDGSPRAPSLKDSDSD